MKVFILIFKDATDEIANNTNLSAHCTIFTIGSLFAAQIVCDPQDSLVNEIDTKEENSQLIHSNDQSLSEPQQKPFIKRLPLIREKQLSSGEKSLLNDSGYFYENRYAVPSLKKQSIKILSRTQSRRNRFEEKINMRLKNHYYDTESDESSNWI
jgi:hypothetical protein